MSLSADQGCTHCGLPVPPDAEPHHAGPRFCCPGCRGAHALIHQLGLGDRAEAEAGFEWIGAFFPAGEKPVRGHFLYGQLYALQAAYYESADAPAAPGASPSGDPRADTFDRWAVRVRDHLLERQREDGAFDEPPVGDLYGTAMALLVLQLPRHSLPILIR